MSLHPKFQVVIRHLYPNATRRDVIIVDNGQGPELGAWNIPNTVPPTDAEIEALVVQAEASAVDREKELQLDRMGLAVFRLLFNHENRIRELANQAQLTAAQFRAAVKAQLD